MAAGLTAEAVMPVCLCKLNRIMKGKHKKNVCIRRGRDDTEGDVSPLVTDNVQLAVMTYGVFVSCTALNNFLMFECGSGDK